jgi:phosphatidylserine/phosphatidylglycerophosphate/cardiolipin synthase-like enzyme
MAKFLTTHATAYYIEEVIQRAAERLMLITPYLKLSKTLLERLKDADRRGVSITIVYGKDQLRPEEKRKLGELENLVLRFMENLHAKCYYNERHAIIGSMNMYEFSEKNNREMSILLVVEEDAEAFEDTLREVRSILDASEEKQLRVARKATATSPAPRQKSAHGRAPGHKGCCIRCGDSVRYDPWTPLCNDCYRTWAAWGNEEFQERYCHRCGNEQHTSKASPLCYTCYGKHPFAAATW